MELTIKNIGIEDYVNHQTLYSKNIRGNFSFNVEPHILERGKTVQINFFRNEQDIKHLMEDWKDSGDLKETKFHVSGNYGTLRLYINEENIMINNTGQADIKVIEYNYSPKKATKIEKGKVAVLIEIEFGLETDNERIKSDLKRLIQEDKI
jgi:hypothetical protein